MTIKRCVALTVASCLFTLGVVQAQLAAPPAAEEVAQEATDKAQPKTADEAFLLALKHGDVEGAKAALAGGADIEKKSLWFLGGCTGASEFLTPQQAVCRFFYDSYGLSSAKRLELLQFLLENGSKPKPELVWSAAVSGDVALLQVFLAHKADLNAKPEPEWQGAPLTGARASLAYIVKRIQEDGPEEAGRSHLNMLSGLTELPLTTQKENLEKVIQVLQQAGATDEDKAA